MSNPRGKLTPAGRKLLVDRITKQGYPVARAAEKYSGGVDPRRGCVRPSLAPSAHRRAGGRVAGPHGLRGQKASARSWQYPGMATHGRAAAVGQRCHLCRTDTCSAGWSPTSACSRMGPSGCGGEGSSRVGHRWTLSAAVGTNAQSKYRELLSLVAVHPVVLWLVAAGARRAFDAYLARGAVQLRPRDTVTFPAVLHDTVPAR